MSKRIVFILVCIISLTRLGAQELTFFNAWQSLSSDAEKAILITGYLLGVDSSQEMIVRTLGADNQAFYTTRRAMNKITSVIKQDGIKALIAAIDYYYSKVKNSDKSLEIAVFDIYGNE